MTDFNDLLEALFPDGLPATDITHTGSTLSDIFRGSDANEWFETLGGADKIRAKGGNDVIYSGDGDDRVNAGSGDDIVDAGEGNDNVKGGDGHDIVSGGAGDDRLSGGDGHDLLLGDEGNDRLNGGDGNDGLSGGSGNDRLVGGNGDDEIFGGTGNDKISAGADDDYVDAGEGDDRVNAGSGDDIVLGGDGKDRLNGQDGDDHLSGGDGHDRLIGGYGDDQLLGDAGNDTLVDGHGDDLLQGGADDDRLVTRFGNDTVEGGDGNDFILSRSDMGEPVIAQDPELPRYNPDQPFMDSDDELTGGAGADTFFFRLDINATEEIAREHTQENGRIDWRGVAGENDNPHDHWVDGIGNDTITDFSFDEGDKIVIHGHTVDPSVEQIDADGDGIADYSVITLVSNQGGNGGAHDGDHLGTITVYGDLITEDDLVLDNMSFFGAFNTLDQFLDGF